MSLSLTRELAPVLSALMIAGRIGSAMAAELGTMRVTEQIDALYAMATEPVHYLVVPRVGGRDADAAAAGRRAPTASASSAAGSSSVNLLGANPVVYWQHTFQFLDLNDVISGLIKAAVFGLILSVTGCTKGFFTTRRRRGRRPRRRPRRWSWAPWSSCSPTSS